MHVDIAGPHDAPAVVCLHGGLGTGAYHWSRLAESLAVARRLHLPDLPGHGHTPLPASGQYSRALLVDAVASYLGELDEPAHVVGFSLGGHVALALAAQLPALFASLTVVGVSVREHEGLRRWREEFDPDELAERYPLWARRLSRLHEPLGGAEAWKAVAHRDSAGLEVDVDVGALAGLDRPVLLVRGDRDPAVDPGHYAELRKTWPDAEELVVPAGHHDVQMTRARIVEPALLDFLTRAERQ